MLTGKSAGLKDQVQSGGVSLPEGRSVPRLFPVVSLAVLVWATSSLPPRSAIAAQLRFEPGSGYLGSFSTLDPLESDVAPGRISVRVQSDVDWRLEVRMREPLRRTADGLVLPTERAPGARGAGPSPIFSLEPHVALSGPASRGSDSVLRDWHELAKALEDYLDRNDPPGTYEGTLLGRLLDSSGDPLTDYVALSIQFDIAPWVEIVDHDVPDFSVPVTDGALEGESPTAAVRLVSNSSWTLLVSGGQEPGPRNHGIGFDPGGLSACALTEGQARWRLLRPGCVPLGPEPQAFIAGDAPRPFSLSNEEIPVVIRFRTAQAIPAGAYGATVRFTARVGQSPP